MTEKPVDLMAALEDSLRRARGDRTRPTWEPVLTIDPRIQFGRVCIPGTRIPADVLAEHVWGGESVDEVAADFDVDRRDVLLSCWWWVSGGPGDSTRWRAWAEYAHREFCRTDGSAISDPDDWQPS